MGQYEGVSTYFDDCHPRRRGGWGSILNRDASSGRGDGAALPIGKGATGEGSVQPGGPHPRGMFEVLSGLIRAWRHRREVRRLLAFDDHNLRDLGLCRSDVSAALSGPLGEDPSARLVAWQDEKRRAAKAQRREWRDA